MVEMIQKNWTFGKVKQVIGEEPNPEFDNKLFFDYGCKVVPGVLTESQKQLEAQQLIFARENLGIPVPTRRILQALTLQDKDELIKEIEEAEQQQNQQKQQMMMLQMQQMQVENKTKLSYATAQEGLAAERMAKIQLDRALNAERLSRAEEERTASTLNIVKGVKEVESMDIAHISQGVSILGQLHNMIMANREPLTKQLGDMPPPSPSAQNQQAPPIPV